MRSSGAADLVSLRGRVCDQYEAVEVVDDGTGLAHVVGIGDDGEPEVDLPNATGRWSGRSADLPV